MWNAFYVPVIVLHGKRRYRDEFVKRIPRSWRVTAWWGKTRVLLYRNVQRFVKMERVTAYGEDSTEYALFAEGTGTVAASGVEVPGDLHAARWAEYQVREQPKRQVSALGAYIIDEYTRRHHRFNITALAEAARLDRGTLYLILRGVRADGTPAQQWPDTLRSIAYSITSGDGSPEAGEWVYARLMDLAGYLPRVPYFPAGVTPPAGEPATSAAQLQQRLDELERKFDEGVAHGIAEYKKQLAQQLLQNGEGA